MGVITTLATSQNGPQQKNINKLKAFKINLKNLAMIDIHDTRGDTRSNTRIWLSLLRKMHSYLSLSLACALPFSLSLLSLLSRVPLWSLPSDVCWRCVFWFQMGLQSPVVVLVEVLDIEPATTAAAAAERPVARGAEEVEEKEEEQEQEHRRRRLLGALLLKSQETQDHKSAVAWRMYVL